MGKHLVRKATRESRHISTRSCKKYQGTWFSTSDKSPGHKKRKSLMEEGKFKTALIS